MADNDYTHDGKYVLNEVSLITHQGIEADLLHVFSEFNMYEDILSDNLSGNIHIIDSNNLLSNLPIVGGETVSLKWATAGKEDTPIEKTFVVYRIGEKIFVNDRTRSYTLYLTTSEHIVNQQTQLIKYYDGTISEIIGKIYRESFPDSNKPFEVEPTKNIHSLIPCHWNPFYTINYFSKLAIGKDNKTGFLFYESNQGFHFRSLESLFEQDPSIEYVKMPSVESKIFDDEAYEERTRHVLSYLVGDNAQILEALSSGSLGHQWLYVDVFNKRLVTNDYEYRNQFDKTQHVDEFPILPDNADDFDQKGGGRFMRTIHPGSTRGNRTDADRLLMNLRHALMMQFSMVETSLEVAGDSDLFVGMTVDFEMPSPEEMKEKFKRDRFFSGKHLITALRHRLTKERYEMYMTIAKDSYSDDPTKGAESL